MKEGEGDDLVVEEPQDESGYSRVEVANHMGVD